VQHRRIRNASIGCEQNCGLCYWRPWVKKKPQNGRVFVSLGRVRMICASGTSSGPSMPLSHHRPAWSVVALRLALLCLTAPLQIVGQPAWAQSSISNDHFWLHDVMARLARHAAHPDKGQCSAREGKVTLHFAIDRTGRVLDVSVAQSSGIAALDREAVNTVKKASPLPPPPDFVPGQRRKFTLPMIFRRGWPCQKARVG